jgi:hypothetical protein
MWGCNESNGAELRIGKPAQLIATRACRNLTRIHAEDPADTALEWRRFDRAFISQDFQGERSTRNLKSRHLFRLRSNIGPIGNVVEPLR